MLRKTVVDNCVSHLFAERGANATPVPMIAEHASVAVGSLYRYYANKDELVARLYAENFSTLELYPSYIHSYIERDVRQLVKVENLRTYQKFMQLCAGRVGQLLNIADIATNCGVNRNTVESWISILEASYVVFTLKPYWENFKKRATKCPNYISMILVWRVHFWTLIHQLNLQ